MSEEFLVINTSPTKVVREQPIEVLPVFSNFDSSNKLLLEMIPEFDLNELHKQEMQTFIRRLKKTMVDYGGLGLSANQCGYRFRMFVMGSKDEQIVCINPRITDKFDDPIKLREGCLSYPGMYLYVPRYKKIEVEYHDENGKLNKEIFEGITAHVFQHELDHMNGIVYTEHVGPLALKMAKDKQSKLVNKIKKTKR
jgi:peptide deformylase